MTEEQAREDIAFIRRAIEDGRGYASARSRDMVVWGIVVAVGYLGTYARVRGWVIFDPGWLWAVCIGLGWIYSLLRIVRRPGAGPQRGAASPMVTALRMLWFGCGIALTVLYIAASWTGGLRDGWFGAVAAGMLGVGFFTSAWLSDLRWLRWIGFGWWAGEAALFALRYRPGGLLLAAALMLLLLAGPGLVLHARRRAAIAA